MAVRQTRAPPPQVPPAIPPDPPPDEDPNEPGPSSRPHRQALPLIYGHGDPGPSRPRPTPIDPFDVFQDASDQPTSGTDSLSSLSAETLTRSYNLMRDCEDLYAVFKDCEIAISRFFNNDLEGARSILQPGVGSSIYHTLGAAIFDFIPSLLAFDNTQMDRAQKTIKICLDLCQNRRRKVTLKESLSNMMRSNYAAFTDHEAHAELVYAEVLLLQACLTVLEGGGSEVTGLVRSSMKVKACFNGYKECVKILKHKKWESVESEVQFKSGTYLGIAIFNILISLLPPRLINLLEYVGFSGDKNAGLADLLKGSAEPGMHSVLCSLCLLGYNLILAHFIGAKINFTVCEEILERELKVYSNGIWFLLFKGRLHLLKKEFNEAKDLYTRSLSCSISWPQLRHMGYWDFMWLHAVVFDWQQAAEFAEKLCNENSWSKTIYYYARASWLLMMENPSEDIKKEVDECFENVVRYKQRIAGKSLPIEKFMVKRAARYRSQGNLLVPGYELLCLWNMFNCMTTDLGHVVIKHLEKLQEEMGNNKESLEWTKDYEGDNLALIGYLNGSMYAALGLPLMSMEPLNSVGRLKHRIREDHFLLPFAACELGYSQFLTGNLQQSLNSLNEIRKKYSGYALESRLQLKLQARISTVKAVIELEDTR